MFYNNYTISENKYVVKAPALSVILISDNSSRTIENAVKNLLNQTFKNFELIIIDNCSTDSTTSKLDVLTMKLMDNRIRVKHLLHKESITQIKNIGLEEADGKYITFLKAEDIISTSYLEELLRPLKSSLSQKYQALSFTGFALVENNCLTKHYFDLPAINSLADIVQYIDLFKFLEGKLYKKQIIDLHKLKFNTDLSEQISNILFVFEYLIICDENMFKKYGTRVSNIFNCRYKLVINNTFAFNYYDSSEVLTLFIKLIELIDLSEYYQDYLKVLKSLFFHYIAPKILTDLLFIENIPKSIKTLLDKIDLLCSIKLGSFIKEIFNKYKNMKNNEIPVIEVEEGKELYSVIKKMHSKQIKDFIITTDKNKINDVYIKNMLILSLLYTDSKNTCLIPVPLNEIKNKDDFITQSLTKQQLLYSYKDTLKDLSVSSECNNINGAFIHTEQLNKKFDFIQVKTIQFKM